MNLDKHDGWREVMEETCILDTKIKFSHQEAELSFNECTHT